jgi:uncharacterized phage protein gp47/JayE
VAETGFTISSLGETVDRVADDVKSHVPGADVRLRRRISRAIALALGGVSYLIQKFALNISRETLPDCASDTGVTRWQKMFGLPDVVPAKATGPVTFTGVDTSVIPAGSELLRGDDFPYTTDALATIVGGVATVGVTASEAGADGDALEGVTLTLSTPISGVDSDAAVAAGDIDGGVSEEGVEQKRTRVLDRMADPPQGGSNPDYVGWVKEAVGNVREVYVYPNEPSIGHVTIRFILEPATGDPADAIPSPTQAQDALDFIVGTAAENYEDAAAPVPVVGDENYRVAIRTSPTHLDAQPVTFTLSALDPNTSTVQTSIDDALKALLLQRGQPGGTIKLSQIIGAIDAAPGEESHTLSLVNGIAPADVVIGADSFPTFGGVTYPP